MIENTFEEKEKIYREIYIPEQADQSAGYVSGKIYFDAGQWIYRPRMIDIGKIIIINKTVNVSFRVFSDLNAARNGSIIQVIRGSSTTSSVSFYQADQSTTMYFQNSFDVTINDIWGIAELIKVNQNAWIVHGNLN